MKQIKKFFGILLFALTFSLLSPAVIPQIGNCVEVQAASASLNKKTAAIYIGKYTQLKVNNYSGKVKWSSSNTQIATVSSTGKVTGKKSGGATISATVGKKVLKCKVTVRSFMSVTPKTIYLDGTDDETIKITLKKNYGLRYSVSNPDIITCTWDDDWYGKNDTITYLYVTADKSGTTYITISNKYNNEKAKIKVVVDMEDEDWGDDDNIEDDDKDIKVESISISKSFDELSIGDRMELSAEVHPSDATDKGVTWYSENEKVATVSRYGIVEAISEGQTRIVAKSNDGGYTASCTITVKSPVYMKLPQLPVTIKQYGYRGNLRKSCIITDVRFITRKSGNQYYYEVRVDGQKTYDEDGSYISSACPIGYKIYRNGAVVKSGTIYSTGVCVGEQFVDCYSNGFIDAGNYELKLLDVR